VAFARGADAGAWLPNVVAAINERFKVDYPNTWAELEAAGFFKAAKKPATFPEITPTGTT